MSPKEYKIIKNTFYEKGSVRLQFYTVKKKVKFYMKMIDDMINNHVDLDSVKHFKEKLRDMRGVAIKRGGEFSFENLVFKELRNQGYLDKLSAYQRTNQDQALSL